MNILVDSTADNNYQYEIYLGIDVIGGRVNAENMNRIKCPTEDNRLTQMWNNIIGKYTYNGYAHEKFIDINDFNEIGPESESESKPKKKGGTRKKKYVSKTTKTNKSFKRPKT